LERDHHAAGKNRSGIAEFLARPLDEDTDHVAFGDEAAGFAEGFPGSPASPDRKAPVQLRKSPTIGVARSSAFVMKRIVRGQSMPTRGGSIADRWFRGYHASALGGDPIHPVAVRGRQVAHEWGHVRPEKVRPEGFRITAPKLRHAEARQEHGGEFSARVAARMSLALTSGQES
jgi:hypothetical protein